MAGQPGWEEQYFESCQEEGRFSFLTSCPVGVVCIICLVSAVIVFSFALSDSFPSTVSWPRKVGWTCGEPN